LLFDVRMSSHRLQSTLRLPLEETILDTTIPLGDPDDLVATRVDRRARWAAVHEQARKIAERNAQLRPAEAPIAPRPSAPRKLLALALVVVTLDIVLFLYWLPR
jgi:hypothetical protein